MITATIERFAFAALNEGMNVDREAGTMRGVSLISVGEALGHGLYVDERTLETALDVLEDMETLPAYVTHRGALFEDRLTREIGMFENFRIEGDKVKADFQAFQSFQEDESRRFNRLFELAEKMPKRFGLSIVFAGMKAWATDVGDIPFDGDNDRPENAAFEFPSIRVEEVTSADFTDSPAANPTGLFTQIDKQPKTKMTKSELETLSQELEASKVELETSVETLSSENSELEVSLSSAKQECSELTEKLDAKSAEVTELSAKVDSLKGQLQASDGALAEKTELAEASASKVEELEDELAKRNGRIIELEALVSGSNPVPGNQGGEDQKPTAAERNSIVAEFAKENKISEAQAVIQLSRIRPELWA